MALKRTKRRKKQHFLDYLLLGILLGVICIIAASALSFTYSVTLERIEQQKVRKLQDSLPQVLPQAIEFSGENHINGLTYFIGYHEREIVGYEIQGNVQGYQSNIKFIVGIDVDGIITGLRILEHGETPGLGARITELKNDRTLFDAIKEVVNKQGHHQEKFPEPWFTASFKGKHYGTLVMGNDEQHIAAITGATVTSKAVLDGVKNLAKEFINEITKASDANN